MASASAPRRCSRAGDRVRQSWFLAQKRPCSPRCLPVHSAAHLDQLSATSGRPVARDANTYTSPDSNEVALLAVGAAIAAVDHAMRTRGRAFTLVPAAVQVKMVAGTEGGYDTCFRRSRRVSNRRSK